MAHRSASDASSLLSMLALPIRSDSESALYIRGKVVRKWGKAGLGDTNHSHGCAIVRIIPLRQNVKLPCTRVAVFATMPEGPAIDLLRTRYEGCPVVCASPLYIIPKDPDQIEV